MNASLFQQSASPLAWTPQEWQDYRTSIEQAKRALNLDRLALIVPVRSLPAVVDPGIGSLPGARDFLTFVSRLGFDAIQIDPEGKTKHSDASPYAGTTFSTSPLYIYLPPLVEDPAWGGILSAETLAETEAHNPRRGTNRVAYSYIFTAQEKALQEAYTRFREKLAALDTLPAAEKEAIQSIDTCFQAFVARNQAWLESDALYEALSTAYGNDYWPLWQGEHAELDRQLLNPENAAPAKARIAEIKAQYGDVIGAYQFAQFIGREQKSRVLQEFQAEAQASGTHVLDIMADRPVGLSDRDVWANQSLFLKNFVLGCPPDYFSEDGQAWGFPVIDPEKIFNPDGSLGPGGLLLKALFEKIFEENPGGVRIDHIIGLIDPWVYPKGERSTRQGARLYSAPEHPALGKYAYITQDALNHAVEPDDEKRVLPEAMTDDVVDRYAGVLGKIVMPAAQAKGIGLSSIICEDLGTLTTPVRAVMAKFGFSGIRVTQFSEPKDEACIHRGVNIPPQHWAMPGSHDNETILAWSRDLVKHNDFLLHQHAKHLAQDLYPHDEAARYALMRELGKDPLALARAKFTELFVSPSRQVQVFFADWLGMEELYNRPGTVGSQNWSLRVPNRFKEAYFTALKEGRGLNLPEVFILALESGGKEQIQKHQALISDLRRYAERLKTQGAA